MHLNFTVGSGLPFGVPDNNIIYRNPYRFAPYHRVDIGFGSPLDTIVDTATLGELDALTIRTNSAREAYDSNVDATNRRAGATLDRMSAKSALQGGYLAAAGTVLTGVGNAYSGYKERRQEAY